MRVHYQLEIWNKVTKHYEPVWYGKSIEWARTMAKKPYNTIHGKVRIVKITHETIK